MSSERADKEPRVKPRKSLRYVTCLSWRFIL